MASLLTHIAPARLFDELLKLLMAGYGVQTWELLQQYGIVEPLLPLTYQILNRDADDHYQKFINSALISTDLRVNAGRPVTPAFIYASSDNRHSAQDCAVNQVHTLARGGNYLRSTKQVLPYLCKTRPLRGRSTYLLM